MKFEVDMYRMEKNYSSKSVKFLLISQIRFLEMTERVMMTSLDQFKVKATVAPT